MAFERRSTPSTPSQDDTALLAVRGWQQSKAAGNDDGGVQSLKIFLSKKASRPVFAANIQGDALIISVKAADEHRFLHLNGFTWAGTTLSVTQAPSQAPSQPFGRSNTPNQVPSGPRNNQQRFNNTNPPNNRQNRSNQSGNAQNRSAPGDNVTMGGSPFNQTNNAQRTGNPQKQEQDAITQILAAVIQKRYNAPQKYLTLESLAAEPEFIQAGLSSQAAAKVFAAVFVTCENHVFETPAKRRDMVESLSLSNNGLTTVKDVIAAASTFSSIKNLDLSNNNIADVGELRFWRNRFRNLEHLILTGNPVAMKPETKDVMRRWYPKLQIYNNEPVRGDHLQAPTPPSSTSPVNPLPTEPHPEFGPESTFGVAVPGKVEEQLIKEQMGLKFSYETRLKMKYVEECLNATNFNYDAALAYLQTHMAAGNVPADAFLQGV